MAIQTKLRKWGNSIGVVLPIQIMKEKNLVEGEEVIIEIEKKSSMSEIFCSLKNWKVNPQKIKDEIRKEEHKDD